MNIVVLGPQGSGKGTQAKLLAKKYALDHFDTGHVLRQIASRNTVLGREVYEIIIVKKELVCARLLREVLQIRLNDLGREQGIVFDGVPRNLEQLEYFEKALQEFGRKIDAVIFIDISKKEATKRIGKRFACEGCKETVILKAGKTLVCSKCGGKLVQRTDDTKEGIKKRLEIFQTETMPVIEYFEKKKLVRKINGEQSIEKVFREILKNVKNQ